MMKIRTSRLFDNFDDQLMHLAAQQSTVLGSSNVFVAHSLNSPDFWSHTRTHYSHGRSQFNSVTVHFGQRDSSGLEQQESERDSRLAMKTCQERRLDLFFFFISLYYGQTKEIRNGQATIFFTNKVTSPRFNCKHNRLSTSLGITRKLRHLSNLKRRQWTTNIHSPAINSMIITRISNSQVSSRRFDSRIVVRRFDTSNLQSMHR